MTSLAVIRKEATRRRREERMRKDFPWTDGAMFGVIVRRLGEQARDDIAWSESLVPPTSPEQFATEVIFVICNSGMRNTVARVIFDRVMPLLRAGSSAWDGFKHKGKSLAIDHIWNHREFLFGTYIARKPEYRLDFLASLPWIGPITKYHAAKNFGVDCVKPDVHLQRLANHAGTSPDVLCRRLAAVTGYRVATVDTILWRACATGLIDSKTGVMREAATGSTQHSREKAKPVCDCGVEH